MLEVKDVHTYYGISGSQRSFSLRVEKEIVTLVVMVQADNLHYPGLLRPRQGKILFEEGSLHCLQNVRREPKVQKVA